MKSAIGGIFMTSMARLGVKRVSLPSPDTPAYLQKASVEQIWSSWRHEKHAPKSADAAERVNQLKRIDEHETALQVALAEVRLEEQGRPQDWRARNGPLVLLGSGHDLSGRSSDTMKRSP